MSAAASNREDFDINPELGTGLRLFLYSQLFVTPQLSPKVQNKFIQVKFIQVVMCESSRAPIEVLHPTKSFCLLAETKIRKVDIDTSRKEPDLSRSTEPPYDLFPLQLPMLGQRFRKQGVEAVLPLV
jgi:hypothetical protein